MRIVPQVSCRPLVVEFQMKAPFPLESLSLFRPVSAADFEGRKRIYADPAFRAALREKIDGGRLGAPFRAIELEDGRRLGAVAAERGVHPVDAALDLALATDLEARFRLAVLNTDEATVAELLAHPATMVGLSDAGAHASQLCDACAPTDLLGRWVREKGVLSLEEGVRRLTSQLLSEADLVKFARRRPDAGAAAAHLHDARELLRRWHETADAVR